MKTIILILVVGVLAIAQNTSVSDAQKVLADTQADAATIATLQGEVAQAGTIAAACPSCLAALSSVLAGAPAGTYTGVEICCGPTTVPATPTGSYVLYIYQSAATTTSGAGVAK
jgi:hypothetical protein